MALLEELGSIPRKIERASLITSGSSGGLNADPAGATFPGCGVSTAKEVVTNNVTKTQDMRSMRGALRHENPILPIVEEEYLKD
jgi:hypothetical protein